MLRLCHLGWPNKTITLVRNGTLATAHLQRTKVSPFATAACSIARLGGTARVFQRRFFFYPSQRRRWGGETDLIASLNGAMEQIGDGREPAARARGGNLC